MCNLKNKWVPFEGKATFQLSPVNICHITLARKKTLVLNLNYCSRSTHETFIRLRRKVLRSTIAHGCLEMFRLFSMCAANGVTVYIF